MFQSSANKFETSDVEQCNDRELTCILKNVLLYKKLMHKFTTGTYKCLNSSHNITSYTKN